MKDLFTFLKQTLLWNQRNQTILFTPMKETQEIKCLSKTDSIDVRVVYPPNWGGKRNFNNWADRLPMPTSFE
jgi:hypothetical protein